MTKATTAEAKEARRKKIGVIVLGMHRSGTSALGGVLNLLGCDAPATLMAPHETNPKGFFESQVLYKLNTEILSSAGSSWNDWQPFNPGWFDSPKAEMFRERAHQAVETEFPGSRLFVLKDPRLCKLLPLYLDVFAEMGLRPAIVHIHRNPMEVAASLQTRDKIDPELGQLIWLRHVLDGESNSRGLQRSFLSYDQLLRNWGGATDRVGKALKINWPRLSTTASTDIDAFLTPTLRHHERPKEQVLDNPLISGWVRDTYAILQRWTESGEAPADHRVLDRINEELTRSSGTFARLIESGKAAAEKARKVEADLGAARTELSGKQATLAEVQARAEQLEKKIAEALAELTDTRTKASEQAAALSTANAQKLEALRAEAEKERAEAQRLQTAVDGIKADLEQKRVAAANLTTTVEGLKGELEQKRAATESLTATVNALKSELEQKRGQADGLNATVTSLKSELEEKRGQADGLNTTVNELKAQLDQKRGEVDAVNATVSSLQSELDQKRVEADILSATTNDLKAQLDQKRGEADGLNATVNSLQSELNQKRGETDGLNTTVNDLRAQLEQKRGETDGLNGTVNHLQSELAQKRHEADGLSATVNDLQSQLHQKRGEIDGLTATVNDLKSELDQKRGEVDQLRTGHGELHSELETTRQRLAEAESGLAAAAQASETLAENEKLAEERAAQIAILQDHLHSAEDSRQTAEEAADALRAEALALNEEITQLRSTLLQRQHEAQDWANTAKAAEEERDAQGAEFKAKEGRLAEELAILGKEIIQLEESLANVRLERDALARVHQDDTARFNAELAQAAQALESEKNTLDELRGQFTRQTNEIATLSKDLTKVEDLLTTERANTKKEREALVRVHQDDTARFNTELAKSAEALQAEKTARAELQGHLTRQKTEIATLSKDLTKTEDLLITERSGAKMERETLARVHQEEAARFSAELAKSAEALQTETRTLTELRKQFTRQTSEIATLARDLTKAEDLLVAERARASTEEQRLRRGIDDQARELATYSDHLRKARADAEELRKRAEAKDAENAVQLAARAEELAQMQQARDALLASTSWKITSPMRRVIGLLRGNR